MKFIEFIEELNKYQNNSNKLIEDVQNYLSSINDDLKIRNVNFKLSEIRALYAFEYNDNTYDPTCSVELIIDDPVDSVGKRMYLGSYGYCKPSFFSEKDEKYLNDKLSFLYNLSTLVLGTDYYDYSNQNYAISYTVDWN